MSRGFRKLPLERVRFAMCRQFSRFSEIFLLALQLVDGLEVIPSPASMVGEKDVAALETFYDDPRVVGQGSGIAAAASGTAESDRLVVAHESVLFRRCPWRDGSIF